MDSLDKDLQNLREAVDEFVLLHEDSDVDQIKILVKMLKDIRVEGVLKSQEDYEDYTTSTDYYDSTC